MPASDIVAAQWAAERRGLERFRTEQPSLFDPQPRHRARSAARRPALRDGRAGVESAREGNAHRPHAKGQQTDLRRAARLTSFSDESRLDAVEQIVPLAEKAGLPMTHLAMAFAIAHPGVTSALDRPAHDGAAR